MNYGFKMNDNGVINHTTWSWHSKAIISYLKKEGFVSLQVYYGEMEPGICFFLFFFLLSGTVMIANNAVTYCVIDINYIKKQLSKGILTLHNNKQTHDLVRTGLCTLRLCKTV